MDFYVCEYVDFEFLFLFDETFAISLKMSYFLHINAKLFDTLSVAKIKHLGSSFSRHLGYSVLVGFGC